MSAELTKWRVFCSTENDWTSGWIETSAGPPLKCFKDTSHSIASNSHQSVETTSKTLVSIEQEAILTGGNFKSSGYSFDALPLQTTEYKVSWPFAITAVVVHVMSGENHLGDYLEAIVGEKTIVGVITSNALKDSKTISVNSTVLQNAKVGFECYLRDEFLGRIVGICITNFTVTFEKALLVDYPPNTYFKVQNKIISNHPLGYPNGNDIGSSNIGGKHIPKNLATTIKYINNSNETKKIHFTIEHLF